MDLRAVQVTKETTQVPQLAGFRAKLLQGNAKLPFPTLAALRGPPSSLRAQPERAGVIADHGPGQRPWGQAPRAAQQALEGGRGSRPWSSGRERVESARFKAVRGGH